MVVQLKIENDSNIVKYITTLRKYDKKLSIGELKRRIESGIYVIEHDMYGWDISDELNDVDRNQLFRKLISELIDIGAKLLIFHKEEEITLQQLDNYLERFYQIKQEVEEDIDREVEEDC